MHGHHRLEDEPMADMNLIPLIDIALTLLIILMVTTVFIHRPGVSLHLPQSATREGAPETSKDLIITVSADGSYHVDGKLESAAALQQRLLVLASRDKESRVLIKGDRDVPYARIMDVMDIVRQAGLTHVVLPTDPKTSASLPAGNALSDSTAAGPAASGSNVVPASAPTMSPAPGLHGAPGGTQGTSPNQNR